MKKIIKILVIIITAICLIAPISYAADKDKVDFKEQVKKEKGSLFEKIIAESIGGIAQTVFDFTAGEKANVGFLSYDTLIFNSGPIGILNTNISPFTDKTWQKTMTWYKVFAGISGSLILIAVIILAYKVINGGLNTARKNEAKESLLRLCFGGVAIALAPVFIKFLLFLNNSFVKMLVDAATNGRLDAHLGRQMMTSISTGNPIATALVISMFIYLFVKLNIKFIVREFTLIIFTIFTPFAAGLWIINKNVTAASIWAGQIIMNIFMQFVYCFLFIIYMQFLPSSGGWAVSLIWAMMILPIADALQNCFQNLTSRIAGIDNEQMSNRVIGGAGAMLGFGIATIKEQFKAPKSNVSNNSNDNTNNGGGFRGIVDRARSLISPTRELSPETDYNGNVNPIRDVIVPKGRANINSTNNNNNIINNVSMSSSNGAVDNTNKESGFKGTKTTSKSIAGKVLKTGAKATGAYLSVGAKMVEGDFSKSPYKNYNKSKPRNNNYKNTEYIENMQNMKNAEKLSEESRKSGDPNEYI